MFSIENKYPIVKFLNIVSPQGGKYLFSRFDSDENKILILDVECE